MARFTISLDDELAGELDGLIARKGYLNRSEAFRDMLRRELAEQDIGAGGGRCVAVLSYAFDHRTRQLAERMTGHQHDHGDLVVSTMHVHIDRDRCVEAVVLRGPVEGVKRIASQMAAETGVEHGAVNFIPCPEPPCDHGRDHEHDHEHEHEHKHGHDHGCG